MKRILLIFINSIRTILICFYKQNKIIMEQDQIHGLIRHALTVIGGALVAKGVIEEEIMMDCIGIVMSVIGVVWSIKSKSK